MSETQAPPAETPAAPPSTAKKYLLDNPLLRGVLDVAAFCSPVPFLLALLNVWLSCFAPEEMKGRDATQVFRQIFEGSGDPPMWAIPLAFLPAIVLLVLLHKKNSAALLIALLLLVTVACGETYILMPLITG